MAVNVPKNEEESELTIAGRLNITSLITTNLSKYKEFYSEVHNSNPVIHRNLTVKRKISKSAKLCSIA
jgi:hypothetical protein